MFNVNTELTAECVKSLADNNRCFTCDKLTTPCVRYPCGHAVCAECVGVAECCLLCITPPPKITHYDDEPLSLRVENAAQLVLAYQELFGEDVNKRVSLSKQQKTEKLLFPKCIQASNKYFNKRKSSTSVSKGKENIKPPVLLPGEEVANRSLKMENKNTYVQNWLNNIQHLASSKTQRKPFADINVNSNNQNIGTKELQTQKYGKRKHFKTISNSVENVVPTKKYKSESSLNEAKDQKKSFIKSNQCKREADESGIVMDDHIIEILDSQEISDKDILACKAVEEAELNQDDICMDLFNDSSYVEHTFPKVSIAPSKDTKQSKVPFYRRSSLHQTCEGHQSCCVIQQDSTNIKNVSITIENKSFVAVVNVSNREENNKPPTAEKKSKIIVLNKGFVTDTHKNSCKEALQTIHEPYVQDCNNENNAKIKFNIKDNLIKGVTISDSDSDSLSSFVEKEKKVIADVHRSCNEIDYGVLSELDLTQCKNRVRHACREDSPLSTDSSDKENYNPNKMKKMKPAKKFCCQKKQDSIIF